MPNMNNKTHEELIDALYPNGKRSVLMRKTPVALIKQFFNGNITRLDAWCILKMVHEQKEECELPQYGILTVFSLSKDNDEFQRLYDQGVQMLIKSGIVDEDLLDEDYQTHKNAIKKPKKNINPRFN